jgi:hypothetical protein
MQTAGVLLLDLGFAIRLEIQFARDDFLQRNVGKTHAGCCLDLRAVPLGQLADPAGNDVDQHLRVGNGFQGFVKELAGHKARNRSKKWSGSLYCAGGFVKSKIA